MGDDWSWGPEESPVQLIDAVHGSIAPVALDIVEARGCDLDPVDATSAQGRLRLTSFVGMEYPPDSDPAGKPEVRTTLWWGDGRPPRMRLLGTAHDHGIPVRVGPVRS